MPVVNPSILIWARETAGLSLADSAKATGIAAVSLAAIESGDKEPTHGQLSKLAERYRRPLTVFYLLRPPIQGDRGEDFRKAPGSLQTDFDPKLDALIRDVRARHDVIKSLLEDEEVEQLPFVGSMSIDVQSSRVVEAVKSTIGFEISKFREAKDEGAAFSYLRGCFEKVGIFVLLIGNLGSHHSNISTKSFRGYAISDRLAPMIVINDNDARSAWSFTAFHEAAHIWLGQTGLSGSSELNRTERLCNEVASELLLPKSDLTEIARIKTSAFEDAIRFVSDFSSGRNVSRRMVAYQLLRLGGIDSALYQRISEQLDDDWLRSKERQRAKSSDGGGPNRYVVLRHRLGPAVVDLARRSMNSGNLTPTRASRLLGVKAGSVSAFLHQPLQKGYA